MDELGLSADSEVVEFLINQYDKTLKGYGNAVKEIVETVKRV